MFDPMADIDSACRDFPFRHPSFPFSNTSVFVESGGTPVFGDLWMAAGPGAKGTVILTPPMGGGDDLDSLIIPLTYAGIHVLQFFPRGTSREGEQYSLPKAVDDVHALLDWVVASSGSDKTSMGTTAGVPLRLDPDRVALCGLGFGGGNVSLAACAESKIANYVIAAAPGNIDTQTTPDYLDQEGPRFRAMKEATGGEIDLGAWFGTLTAADKKRLGFVGQAPKLTEKHVLMIGAKHDVISPISESHEPYLSAFHKAGAKHLTDIILDTDHMFLTKRYAIFQLIISWLRQRGF